MQVISKIQHCYMKGMQWNTYAKVQCTKQLYVEGLSRQGTKNKANRE